MRCRSLARTILFRRFRFRTVQVTLTSFGLRTDFRFGLALHELHQELHVPQTPTKSKTNHNGRLTLAPRCSSIRTICNRLSPTGERIVRTMPKLNTKTLGGLTRCRIRHCAIQGPPRAAATSRIGCAAAAAGSAVAAVACALHVHVHAPPLADAAAVAAAAAGAAAAGVAGLGVGVAADTAVASVEGSVRTTST